MHADRFAPLPEDAARRWRKFANWDRPYFPSVVGLQVEELRTDYCRMRLPYRPELEQPDGLVHGGAIATLIDTVVVPAVGAAYEPGWMFATLTMDIQYLGAVAREDAVAEGWVTQRGRSIVFCRAEVVTAGGRPAAAGTLTYKVSPPRA
ncbi:MAG TPA: PaaI family thioesterase [Acidimicrobiales bacterium]|nr:PaaI family thioesterase [Acidimicrobiales bacterium]